VGLGTEPATEFTVRNAGQTPLAIDIPSMPKGLRLLHIDKTIAPAGSGVIRLAVDTFQAGPITTWKVEVTTNDPAKRIVDLTVKADVRAYLAVTPPSARFSFVQFEREGGTSHVLSTIDETNVELLGVDSPFDYITATSRELKGADRVKDTPGRQWRVDLTIKKDAPVGSIGGYVILRTNHPHQPRAFLPVTGFVRPLFAVTPPSVDIPDITPNDGSAPVLTLVVKNFGSAPIEITRASSDIAGLDAKLIVVEAGHVWRVELRLPSTAGGNQMPAGPFAGTLRLQTTSTNVPELKVSIKGSRVAATP
jgi:hypothetical protein